MPLQRLAMIGARGHTGYVLRALPAMPRVRLVAVADGAADDPVAPLVDWARQNGHEPRAFDDWRVMLDQAKPDAVVVCGPFELHARMSIEAIKRGVHVFVEKPAALTLEDLHALREAHCAHPQVHVAGMMGSRYEPGFFTAWQLVRQGEIGDVRLLNARKSYKLGDRPGYYGDRATYGGTIPWVGSHAIDWVLWMCPYAVESIYAAHSSQRNDGHGTMERSAVCELVIAAGRFASISIDLFRPGNAPSHGDDWLRVVGTGGVIEARSNSLTLINARNDGSTPVPVACDRQVFRDFADHVDGQQTGLIDARSTFVLTEVCLLARQAADERRVMHVGAEKLLKY
jgi:predicted dehydrogenase